jgi:hypothetical protein
MCGSRANGRCRIGELDGVASASDSRAVDARLPQMWGLTHLGIRETSLPMVNRTELPIAFAEDGSVVINFGILSGREATQAELDRLAHVLRKAGAGGDMTITAERRQDYGRGFEAVVHQVHVTLAGSPTPRVQAFCREWALSCAEDRTVEPLELP